jgi:hypothetical protein
MLRFEFESGTVLWFYFYLYSYGESHLLISWCVGDRCDIASNNEDLGRSRRPSAADCGWSNTGRILDSQIIERLSDTVCGLHRAQGDKERGCLG